MALIICPECGKEISDAVDRCLHCGYPIKEKKRIDWKLSKKTIVIFGIFAAAATALIIVFNFLKLSPTEQIEVDATIKAISEIGDVDLNSGHEIEKAEILYDNMTSKSRLFVNNVDELKKDREIFNTLKAEQVSSLIGIIGEVTENSSKDIDVARKYYDELSEEQQKLVKNYGELVGAEESISELRVESVKRAIDELGTISLDSKDQLS